MSDDIVVELGLTKKQVKSLCWVLACWLKQYGASEGSLIKEHVTEIKEALEDI